jgi:hypothetical protein
MKASHLTIIDAVLKQTQIYFEAESYEEIQRACSANSSG